MTQTAVQYPDLSQMFGKASLMPTFMGMDRFKQAQDNEKQNLATIMQQNQIAKDKAPLDLEHLMAQTAESKARVPYMQAQTQALQDQNQMSADIPKEMRVKAKMAELAAKMSDAEFKQMENSLNTQISNPNIDQSVRQQLLSVRDLLPEMHKERMKIQGQRETSESVAHIQGGYAQGRTETTANAQMQREQLKAQQRVKAAQTLDQQLAGMKKASEKIAHLKSVIPFIEDDDLKQKYIDIHNKLVPDANAERPSAQDVVDPAATARSGQVTTNPPPQVAPYDGAKGKKEYTLQELKARYPNATDQQIRDAAKAKGIIVK